jgi:hypothetical protein
MVLEKRILRHRSYEALLQGSLEWQTFFLVPQGWVSAVVVSFALMMASHGK